MAAGGNHAALARNAVISAGRTQMGGGGRGSLLAHLRAAPYLRAACALGNYPVRTVANHAAAHCGGVLLLRADRDALSRNDQKADDSEDGSSSSRSSVTAAGVTVPILVGEDDPDHPGPFAPGVAATGSYGERVTRIGGRTVLREGSGQPSPGEVGQMRRTIVLVPVVALAVLMMAPAANASRNATREKVTFDYSFEPQAGEACDFAYAETGSGWFNLVTVGSGPKMEIIAGGTSFFSHENVDTREVQTEKVVYQDIIFYEEQRIVEAGLLWHLRDAEGKLILVEAGLIVYDLNENVLKVTPNRTPGLWEVMCPALGGEPA